jgi:phosphoribosyl 1,2-cyclic phosphodiesterase
MAGSSFGVQIWGARGTVPTPCAEKLRYGGNTSCLAVALSDEEYIVLDCGTGMRGLGNSLAKNPKDARRRFWVFFTHYHFDHVEGLSLFHPLYDAASTITFHGFEPGGRSVRDVLESLIAPPYFPVTLAGSPARIDYVAIDRAPRQIGDIVVRSLPLNHPDGCLSYRLDHGDRRIVYATDHEHGDSATDRALIEFARGASTLIYDATYLRAEYEELRRGWGHSTWYAAVQTAIAAGVGTLVLFHHHPDHTDAELDRILEVARKEFPSTEVAREGLVLPL